MPLAGEHDLVALGVSAHGEMGGFLGGVFGWAKDEAAGGAQSVARGEEVADLEGQPGPRALAFATAVDAENAASDGEFGHDVGLAHDFGIEDVAVETHRPRHVFCPDEIFQFFDVHEAEVAAHRPARGAKFLLFIVRKYR